MQVIFIPPLKKLQRKGLELHLEAGGWRLNLETRRTAAVDEAPYTRGHAKKAFGMVADI